MNEEVDLEDPAEKYLPVITCREISGKNMNIPTLAGAGALRSTAAGMLTFLGANLGIEHSPLLPAMEMAHQG